MFVNRSLLNSKHASGKLHTQVVLAMINVVTVMVKFAQLVCHNANFSLANRNPAIEPPIHSVPVSCKYPQSYKRSAFVYTSTSRLGSLVSASMNACNPIYL